MPIRSKIAESFREKAKSLDFWVHLFLFACLAIAFWPLTKWFAQTAHAQSRILHALIVLGTAAILLVRFGKVPIKNPLTLNNSSRNAVVFTFTLLILNFGLGLLIESLSPPPSIAGYAAIGMTILTIAAYCSGIAAAILFTFGEGTKRVAYTVCSTFGIFILISTFMEVADWPLRTAAGHLSESVLNLLGQSTELGLYTPQGAPPMLILIVNEHPFHVASECNGFGIIITSLLIAALLGFYRRLNAVDLTVNLLVGIALGFFFNTLRIVIIVLLAPSMMSHYDLMHEIVGGITFWGCLILTWLMLNGPMRDEPT